MRYGHPTNRAILSVQGITACDHYKHARFSWNAPVIYAIDHNPFYFGDIS